jgi:adenylate cyclase
MAMCEAWEAAYAQYLRRDWQAASVHFAALAAQQPMDALVRLYLRRVQDYLRDPPPPDWNGVSVYTEK